ncbi:hypothetical protein NCCP1664_23960 [Zafaria cholistanensis]|uniref:Uncharacterized protein n=1 Tax=Zafaria cholistanensis TaxID=1682741 RepID=A0A5A7NV69_9MICC|nr:hypothetical protein [Zafaria cholistanensis]GER23901.1 hypothetical protein NCCP1664_23960 [Zafaria cholistanensis]
MLHRIARTVFTASLATALLGGVLLILWQALGLAAGDAGILTAPNGVFKTVLCIAASVASIAAYILVHVKQRQPAHLVQVGTR